MGERERGGETCWARADDGDVARLSNLGNVAVTH
jgi:hypothetical protein